MASRLQFHIVSESLTAVSNFKEGTCFVDSGDTAFIVGNSDSAINLYLVASNQSGR
jgi:hypothetical protein